MVKVYDFSVYAARRAERLAAEEVGKCMNQINQVGAVIALKRKVCDWHEIHLSNEEKVAVS